MTLSQSKIKLNTDPAINAVLSHYITFIHERFGITMSAHQNYELHKTIKDACIKFKYTPEEYLNQLLNSTNESPLLEHFIAGITVGETYFFRDAKQMQLLQQSVLPEIIQLKRKQTNLSIRIWSAGCATGEEIYSIAMLLNELLPDIDLWTIKLLATDINISSLHKALIGSYSDWSMRSTSDYFKKKYFTEEKNRFILSQRIRDLVNFDYINLNDNSYPSMFNGTNAQDFIICRNVLIYIDRNNIPSLMMRINQSLVEGGYLMLGASDPVNVSGTELVYHAQKGLLFSRSPILQTKAITLPKITDLIHAIKKPIEVIKQTRPRVFAKAAHPINRDLVTEAIDLANQGKLIDAIFLCEKGFKSEPMNKMYHFIYGLAQLELNKLPEAESALRKTLYLDNQFVSAHLQLGLLLLRQHHCVAGLKSLNNALSIVGTKTPDETVPGSPGLSYKHISEILNKEINLYKTTES